MTSKKWMMLKGLLVLYYKNLKMSPRIFISYYYCDILLWNVAYYSFIIMRKSTVLVSII